MIKSLDSTAYTFDTTANVFTGRWEGPGEFLDLENQFDVVLNQFLGTQLGWGPQYRYVLALNNEAFDSISSVAFSDIQLAASQVQTFDSIATTGTLAAIWYLDGASTFAVSQLANADIYFQLSHSRAFDDIIDLTVAAVEIDASAIQILADITQSASAEVGAVFYTTSTFDDISGATFASLSNYLDQTIQFDDLAQTAVAGFGLIATSVSTFSIGMTAKALNPFYREDGIEDIPVWLFEANWVDDLTETLEWQTDVLTSPTGAEQRRALRRFPRRTLEFRIMAIDRERAYLDASLMRNGARNWWLPLWHESFVLEGEADGAFLPVEDADVTSLAPGDIVFLRHESFFEYGMAEIASVDTSGIHLTRNLLKAWPANTIVNRVRRARLTEQPKPRREADNAVTAQVQFRVVEQNDGPALSGLPSYRDFPVFIDAPNEVERLEYAYERMVEEIDNRTGIPAQYDSAGIAFTTQRFAWLLEGHAEHASFMSMLYSFRGRQGAFWLPTFFNDLELAEPIQSGDESLIVELSGYTELGGPAPSRQDILIELSDGSMIMRRIEAAIISEGREVLAVDQAFAETINQQAVIRISFMALSRLNQDVVEIQHKTDVSGASTVAVTMRAVPDLRQANPGF